MLSPESSSHIFIVTTNELLSATTPEAALPVEEHPLSPFTPPGMKLIVLGSFPPGRNRWCMEFFYPNYTNDMWRIFGLCFFDDKLKFVDERRKTFHKEAIEKFLTSKKIGLYDAATAVIRTKNTASDKDLLIVRPADIPQMLRHHPQCKAIVTTGQKSTELVCECFGIGMPAMGSFTTFHFNGRTIKLYRMPSSSRAYPLSPIKKAQYYSKMFQHEGILPPGIPYKK